MASSFSDLGIELMATGENAGTWGTKTNTNLQIVEKAIAGYVEQAVTSGGTTALSITDGDATESTSVARHAVIKLTGTISGNSIVTVPDSIEKVYIVVNGTSGSYTVQFKTASGTGITFAATEKTTKMVFSDGTNIVDTGFALGVAADDISTGDAAVTIGTSTGDITIDSPADIVLDADGANVTVKDGGTTTLDIVSNGATDVTLDAPGDIHLDADGGDIKFYDGGTQFGEVTNSSTDLVIKSTTSDKDVIIKGNDGGSAITALTLDMSAAGAATFNDKVIATELDISGDVDVDGTLETDAITLNGTSFIKLEGTNFTDSLLIGHATTGTLDAAEDNTGVGINALESLTSGDKNTALGHQAGKAITTASQNVYLGNLAGYQNTSSNFNIGIGDSALAGSDGSTASNVAIGALALNVASGANFNIAIGRDAGREVTTGDNNIFIGYNSGANDSTAGITTGSGNVIIGQVDPDSRTNNRQLKITGNDGSSSTTWISGDSSGIVTFADDIKIKDDGTIGSASAATAMTIESSGQVNFVGDINVADDVFMSSDSAQFTFGANSEIRLQHVHNAGLQILHTATGDDSTVNLTLATDEADIAVDDVIGILNFQAVSEGTGTDSRLVAASIAAVSEGDFAADNNATKLSFRTAASETAAEKMSLSSDGTLTVSHDVILANNSFVQFGDAGEKIVGDGTDLDIHSSGNLDINAASLNVISANANIANFTSQGSKVFVMTNSSQDVILETDVSDKDLILKGNDGGSVITALTLDMSEAGAATFNSTITANSQDVILGKLEGTNFTDSLLVGHGTHGTLSGASQNLGVGVAALDAITSGDDNTGAGFGAGSGITSGSKNTVIGSRSGVALTTASENTIVGYNGLQSVSTSGSQNTGIGMEVLKGVTNGDYNTAVGYKAGDAITEGKGNVVIGANVDVSSNTGDRQLLIAGYDGTTTTSWITGDSNGVVTLADDLVIKDGGTIGVASDADSITIASDGVVTFSQAPVFPDGSIAIADLDIDGGTDIGAAIVDADLFIVDDGAGGTNRKVTASRIKTYVGATSQGKALAFSLIFGY
jgi:hypothetical protein